MLKPCFKFTNFSKKNYVLLARFSVHRSSFKFFFLLLPCHFILTHETMCQCLASAICSLSFSFLESDLTYSSHSATLNTRTTRIIHKVRNGRLKCGWFVNGPKHVGVGLHQTTGRTMSARWTEPHSRRLNDDGESTPTPDEPGNGGRSSMTFETRAVSEGGVLAAVFWAALTDVGLRSWRSRRLTETLADTLIFRPIHK